MKKKLVRFTACLLAALLLVTPLCVFADDADLTGGLLISPAPRSAVSYYRSRKTLSDWWEVLALTAAGVDLEAEGFVLPAMDGEAILASGSATAMAKAILSLGAIGKNPRLALGESVRFDLVRTLAALQQENGAFGSYLNEQIFAIIALESTDPAAYRRDAALAYLCSCRLADGGFAYFGETGDVDLTAMALLAFQFFRGNEAAESCIQSAVAFLEASMNADGGFPSAWEPGVEPSESISAAISGLIAVGVDLSAEPFAKLPARLAEYRTADGGYAHALGTDGGPTSPSTDTADPYATYQALLAEGELKSGISAYASFAYPCTTAETMFAGKAPDASAAKAFAALYNRGVVTGRPVREAAADEALTMGELVVLLDRISGGKDAAAAGSWYAGALSRVGEKAGIRPERFEASAPVSVTAFYQAVDGVCHAVAVGHFADSSAVTRGEAILSLAILLGLDVQ